MWMEFIMVTIELTCPELILIEYGDIQEKILTLRFFT